MLYGRAVIVRMQCIDAHPVNKQLMGLFVQFIGILFFLEEYLCLMLETASPCILVTSLPQASQV